MSNIQDVSNYGEGDSNKIVKKKAPMTNNERLELAQKLDEDLDTFISGLEKRSYTEGWPQDRWQEEMEKHPFFMSKSPEAGEELSPLMQGLQDLKYDANENTPEELALSYKEDGNFNFKYKKYRLAILSYTEGIKQKCSDNDLNSQLYNNRSAAHYFLKNYRSSLNDCLAALKFKPDYIKTLCRIAQCYNHLKSYEMCVEYCVKVLEKDPNNKEICSLRTDASKKKMIKARDERKKKSQDKKKNESDEELLKVIKERGIKMFGIDSGELIISEVEPRFPEIIEHKVYLDNGHLVWPVMFLYPEYQVTDFIQEFHEDSCFRDHLSEMFEEPPSWDEEKKYKPEKLSIYYEDVNGRPHLVQHDAILRETVTKKDFRVDHGTPAFIILIKDSKVERNYLTSC